jgi:hypothetical protein
MAAAAPLLDEALAAFVQTGVSINAASRGAGNVPAVARANGCRVAVDRRTVGIVLPASKSAALLEAVRGSGTLAVVFSEPATHRTYQLKGTDATVVPATDEDRAAAARWVHAFAAVLAPLGYPEDVFRALLGAEAEDLVVVTFTPTAAFDQTPGPRAGAPLAAA